MLQISHKKYPGNKKQTPASACSCQHWKLTILLSALKPEHDRLGHSKRPSPLNTPLPTSAHVCCWEQEADGSESQTTTPEPLNLYIKRRQSPFCGYSFIKKKKRLHLQALSCSCHCQQWKHPHPVSAHKDHTSKFQTKHTSGIQITYRISSLTCSPCL